MIKQYMFPKKYPFVREYSQTLVFKLTLDIGYVTDDKLFTHGKGCVEDVLEHFKKLDYITNGIPKIAILVGFQKGGHDWQYPQYGPVDSCYHSIAHPELSPRDALVYLMEEAARLYHTDCTVHANLVDAYPDSLIWDEYISKGLICTDEKGEMKKQWFDEQNQRQAYAVNLAKAWDAGALQEQIDSLMALLPPIVETKSIYFDANCVFISSWPDTSREDQITATKNIVDYVNNKYGCDVIGEYGLARQYGFVPFGQTWDSHSAGMLENPLKVPSYLLCGGSANCGSCKQMELFGYSIQLGMEKNEMNEAEITEQFFRHSLPYFYLNKKLRLSYQETANAAYFSDGIVSLLKKDGQRQISGEKGFLLQDGGDVFVPADWNEQFEILVYSKEGASKQWILPAEWENVRSVELYQMGPFPLKCIERNRPIDGKSIFLYLRPGEALCIRSADILKTFSPSSAKLIGVDRETHGSWESNLDGSIAVFPESGKSDYQVITAGHETGLRVTGANVVSRYIPFSDDRLLHKGNTCHKAWESGLHFTVEIRTGQEQAVTFYLLDYEGLGRRTLIEALDAADGQRLASCVVENPSEGCCASFRCNGSVTFRFTRFYGDCMEHTECPSLWGIILEQ